MEIAPEFLQEIFCCRLVWWIDLFLIKHTMLVFMDAVASVIRDGLGFITGPTTYHQPGQVVCILKQRSINTDPGIPYRTGLANLWLVCSKWHARWLCVAHIVSWIWEKINYLSCKITEISKYTLTNMEEKRLSYAI